MNSFSKERREQLKNYFKVDEVHEISYENALLLFRKAGFSEIGASQLLHGVIEYDEPLCREAVEQKVASCLRRAAKEKRERETPPILGFYTTPEEDFQV